MRVVETYSHLNGKEFLLVHRKKLFNEIMAAIRRINAAKWKTKVSKEKKMKGQKLFSPKDMNEAFKKEFEKMGWSESRYNYYITLRRELMEATMQMDSSEQKEFLESKGEHPIYSYNQTDFVKDKVAVEIQFGKYAFVAYDLFVKHLLFFTGGVIDVGVEILPMKEMQQEMSSGVAYYEGEVYNVMRHGRTNPPVPLLIIGVAP